MESFQGRKHHRHRAGTVYGKWTTTVS